MKKKVRKQIYEKCKNFHGGGGVLETVPTNPLRNKKGGRCREVKAAPLHMRKEVDAL